MQFLIKQNNFFSISKKTWNYIEDKIEDINFFKKIACVLLIEANEINIHRLLTCLMNNTALLEKFLL